MAPVTTELKDSELQQDSQDAASSKDIVMNNAEISVVLRSLIASNDIDTFRIVLQSVNVKLSLADVFVLACHHDRAEFMEVMFDGDWIPRLVDMNNSAKIVLLAKLLRQNNVTNFKTVLETIEDKSILDDIFTDACLFGRDDFVSLMIDCGVDVNIAYSRGNRSTGLMCAVRRNCESTVQLLLARGANVMLTNALHQTVLDMCYVDSILKILETAKDAQNAAKETLPDGEIETDSAVPIHKTTQTGDEIIVTHNGQIYFKKQGTEHFVVV